jgi:two-component system cell cycle sensor histidine kinase PleC
VASVFRVERLLQEAPALSADATGGSAYDLLLDRPELPGVVVLGDDRLIGYVDRNSLLTRFAQHLMRDFHIKRPVTLLVDRTPLIVDAEASIAELTERVSHDKPGALTAGFVIVRKGRYAGVGDAREMLKLSVEEARQRSRELAEARDRAETASKAKSLFLANMSHELRTPLNAVIGFAQLLLADKRKPLDISHADYVRDIHDSGQHLLDLINDVLDLSKAESGKLTLQDELAELRSLVRAAMRQVEDRAEKAELTLTSALPDAAIELICDPIKMKQILMNLLSNAVKFTPGGGSVTVRASLVESGDLELDVIDTGVGMTEEQIPLALSTFGQIEHNLNRQHQGTGLGLPLTKQLVELHGGALEIDSEPGRGTTMRVRFPAARVTVREPGARSALPNFLSAPIEIQEPLRG